MKLATCFKIYPALEHRKTGAGACVARGFHSGAGSRSLGQLAVVPYGVLSQRILPLRALAVLEDLTQGGQPDMQISVPLQSADGLGQNPVGFGKQRRRKV